MNRRSFFQLLGMAPVAAVLPAAAFASGGYAGSRSDYMVGEVASESITPIKTYYMGEIGPEIKNLPAVRSQEICGLQKTFVEWVGDDGWVRNELVKVRPL